MATECECPQCQALCRHEPGWFVPEEIEPAAAFLGLSVAELTDRYLTQQAMVTGTALAPRQKPRSMECIFFVSGRCQIHPVKPYECRKVFGCEPDRRHTRIRDLIARRWR